ncbi:transposable element Tcb2 transposase [Trichonephila clavipes]|nr:transposable element Tcb2 transposase [Trichonephila clavipes]
MFFSDESRFLFIRITGVFSSGGTVAVGIILRSCTKVSGGGGGVLVYGGISIDGRTDLYIIRDGPLTARRYRDDLLGPITADPCAAAIGDDFILMDDNCRPPRAILVEDFFSRKESYEWNGQRVSDMDPTRASLGRSEEDELLAANVPRNSPRTGKSSSGRVGQNPSTRD